MEKEKRWGSKARVHRHSTARAKERKTTLHQYIETVTTQHTVQRSKATDFGSLGEDSTSRMMPVTASCAEGARGHVFVFPDSLEMSSTVGFALFCTVVLASSSFLSRMQPADLEYCSGS